MPIGPLPGTGASSGQRREGGSGWREEPQTPMVSTDGCQCSSVSVPRRAWQGEAPGWEVGQGWERCGGTHCCGALGTEIHVPSGKEAWTLSLAPAGTWPPSSPGALCGQEAGHSWAFLRLVEMLRPVLPISIPHEPPK